MKAFAAKGVSCPYKEVCPEEKQANNLIGEKLFERLRTRGIW
jgi:hypothetical protein